MTSSLSISRFRYRFTPSWPMCLLALFGMVFFSCLGVWQLHRADEKKELLAYEAALEKRAPRAWLGEEDNVQAFERVQFRGKILPQQLFLDNQYHAHHLGYHVISPVMMENKRVVLVDRGWVSAGATRQVLPEVVTPQQSLELSGTIYQPRGAPWVLGAGIEIRQENQAVIETLDFQLISQFLHKSVYPFIIRLDAQSPAGYVRDWVTVVMPPVRHLGYAVQWFALALVVLILFVGLNLKKYDTIHSK